MSLILGPHQDNDRAQITGGQFRPSESLGGQLGRLAAGMAQGAAQTALRAVTEQLLGLRFDPAPEYLFVVELTGIIVGLFTECSGIEIKREVKSWREGGVNNYEHQLPGPVSYSTITLKRGLSLSRALWDWFQAGLYDLNVQRINFSIIQGAPGYNIATLIAGAAGMAAAGGSQAESVASQIFGRGFGKVKHWNVIDAWPTEWKGSDLKTSSNSVAIETLKIAHHGLELSYEVGTPLNLGASIVGGIATAISGPSGPSEPEDTCEPVTQVNIAGPSAEVSVGETVTLTASVEPTNATDPITYHWDFGDETTEETFGATITHTYDEADTYTVQLTAENMCGEASASFEVTVTSKPVTAVSLSGPDELKVNQEANFTAEITPGDASPPINYEWDLGDGTTLETTDADVEHTYTTEGTYTITVNVTNPGGSANATFDVVVRPCVAVTAISINGPTQLKVDETGEFEADAGDVTQPVTYTWQVFQGAAASITSGATPDEEIETTDAGFSYTFEHDSNQTYPATYTVKVKAENECTTTPQEATLEVTVECKAVSSVAMGGPGKLEVGETGDFEAVVTPGDATEPVTYTWEVIDSGSNVIAKEETEQASFSYTFEYDSNQTYPATYTVKVSTDNVCTTTPSEDSLDVTVECTEVSSVSISGPDELVVDESGDFEADAGDATPPITYEWTVEESGTVEHTDLSEQASLSYTFEHDSTKTYPVDYAVKVKASNVCTASPQESSHTVTVTCKEVSSLSISGPDSLTAGDTGNFSAEVEPSDAKTPITYEWTVEKGGTVEHTDLSEQNSLDYTFEESGTYDVKVVAWNQCDTNPSSPATHSVTVS